MPSRYAIHAIVAMGFLNNAALRAEELGLKNERILPFFILSSRFYTCFCPVGAAQCLLPPLD